MKRSSGYSTLLLALLYVIVLFSSPANAATDLDGDGDIDLEDYIAEQIQINPNYDPAAQTGGIRLDSENLTSANGASS
ncbi:MAG: hypothetical protein KAJ07_02090 [Planctomycetes bacterium]|nr:hypothetical protein [Planctomycetota bacterium]